VRRLIDRTRSSRQTAAGSVGGRPDNGDVPRTSFDPATLERAAADVTRSVTVPRFEFRSDVPPDLLRLLVGSGPWAVWLNWPPADPTHEVAESRSELGAG
jgi:hypothetical protein